MDRKPRNVARPPARFQLSRYDRIRLIVNRNVMRVVSEVQRIPVTSPVLVRVDRF